MSNIENLVGNVDPNILNFLLNTNKSSLEFVMAFATNETGGVVENNTLIYYEKK